MLARRLCYALQGYLPTRHISHLGAPYMERSYVATVFGVRVYLHRFVACDEDGVHDHPFRYSASLILCICLELIATAIILVPFRDKGESGATASGDASS